jgi:Putative beta-barrel porin 2
MKNEVRRLALAALSVCLLPVSVASAQTFERVEEQARFRFGPLRLTPWIALTDVGVDSNVFNETVNPKSDFTAALGPATHVWMNVGASRIKAKVSGQYLFFGKYEGQRSWATADEGRWEWPLASVTPFLTGAYASTRQRPSYEIDARVRQRNHAFGAGADVRVGGRTLLTLSATRSELDFDDDEGVAGILLSSSLNRRSDAEEIAVRHELTPLTTFLVRAQGIQDRFENSPLRDSDSVRVLSGFELKPDALIAGSAFVGVRSLSPEDSRVPSYTGIVASVNASYVVVSTRFEVRVSRDLEYSYEPTQPYYALTDTLLTVTQRMTTTWDIVGRGGWQQLGYQHLTALDGAERVDRGTVYGAGVGYRVGHTLRLGFDVNRVERRSDAQAISDYSGLRFGGSVTYGLPQ